MNPKFTPSPWEVYRTPIHNREIHQVFAPESKSRHWIANVQADAGEDGDGMDNANLIAAAPELYEALKGAQDELRLIRMKDTTDVYDPTIRIRIELALAKAEGKHP